MNDRRRHPRFWNAPVPRWQLLAAYVLITVAAFIGFDRSEQADQKLTQTLATVQRAEDRTAKTAEIVKSNQCEVLNRLAETKLFIRDFLRAEGQDPDEPLSPGELSRFDEADRRLTEGIGALENDVKTLSGCQLFEILSSRSP